MKKETLEKIDNLNELSFEYRDSDPPYSHELAREALELSLENSYDRGAGFAYLNIGKYHFSMSDLDSSMVYLNKANELSSKVNDNATLVKIFNAIARVHFVKNDYLTCIEYLEKALNICEEQNDDYQISIVNNIAVVLMRCDRYNDALTYLEKAFKRCLEVRYFDTGVIMENMAECYVRTGKFDEAESLHQRILSGEYAVNTPQAMGVSNVIMAEIFNLKGDTEKSIEYYEKAGRYFDPEKERYFHVEWSVEFSRMLLKKERFDKAYEVLKRTEKYVADNPNKDVLSRFFEILSTVCEKKGLFEEALDNYRRFTHILDELRSSKLEKKIEQLTKKAEIEEAKKQERIRNEKRLQTLLSITQYNPRQAEDLIGFTLEEILKITESPVGHIYEYDTSKYEVKFDIWNSSPGNDLEIESMESIRDGEPLFLEKTIESEEPIIANEIETSELSNTGICRFMGVKSRFGVNVIGVGLLNKERGYSETDARQVNLILDFLNKRLEINREQRKVFDSEQRYRSLVENTEDIIFSTDKLWKITSINRSGEFFLNMERNEIIGRSLSFFGRNPEQLERWMTNLGKLKKGAISVVFNEQYYDSTGQTRHFNVSLNPLLDLQKRLSGVSGIMRDITDILKNEEAIRKLAYYDPITDLQNAVSIRETINCLIESRRDFSLIYVNVNKFKELNDNLGQEVGNRLLKTLSERLVSAFGEESVSRIVGDEFLVIVEGKDRHLIESSRDKIAEVFDRPFTLEGYSYSLTSSTGVSRYPKDGEAVTELIKLANIASRGSISVGRNTFRVFDGSMLASVNRAFMIKNEIRNALDRRELYTVFQPIVRANTLKVDSLEVLLRWKNPNLGSVQPAEFIPYLEVTGEINRIGKWVMESVCYQWQSLQKASGDDLKLSVNLSTVQLKNENLVEDLKQIIHDSGIPAERLIIEITESGFMEDLSNARVVIDLIRELGVKVALDDFGSGYSSFNYLSELPIDILKIDKVFVDKIGENNDRAILIDTIIELSHRLGIEVVGEGVEREEQFKYLKSRSCDFLQGFYFYKPAEIDNTIRLLKSQRKN